MGNANRYLEIIDQKRIELLTREETDHLLELYNLYRGNSDKIPILHFGLMINRASESKILSKFFRLFGRKGKMDFRGLRGLYAIYTSSNYQHKIGFITKLLFGKRQKIPEEKYKQKLTLLFTGWEMVNYFLDQSRINEIADGKRMIFQKNFYDLCNNEKLKPYFEQFTLLTEVISSSEYTEKLISNSDEVKENLFNVNYLCDCETKVESEPTKEELTTIYNGMTFAYINTTNNLLYIQQFEKFLKEGNLAQFMIDIISQYLKRLVNKNFVLIENIREFFIHFDPSLPIIDKIKFIFQMIAYPNLKASNEEIKKSLEINELKSDCKNSEKINSEEFETLLKDEDLCRISSQIDLLSIIPYLYFGLSPQTSSMTKLLLKHLLGNINLDEVLKEFFLIDNYFFVIEMEFWNSIIGGGTGEQFVCEVNNEKLYKSGPFIDKSFKYKKDFVILPNSLYYKISKYIRCHPEIKYVKEVKPLDEINNKEDFFVDTENGFISCKISETECEEIDLYPVNCIFLSVNNIINQIKNNKKSKQVTIEEFMDFINKEYGEPRSIRNSLSQQSRRHKMFQIKESLVKAVRGNREFNLYTFYEKIFKEVDLEKTFEEMKIWNFCVFLVDIKDNGIYSYDTLNSRTRSGSLNEDQDEAVSDRKNEDEDKENKDKDKEKEEGEEEKKKENKDQQSSEQETKDTENGKSNTVEKENQLTPEMKKLLKEEEKKQKKIAKEQEEIRKKLKKEAEAEAKRIRKEQEELRRKIEKEEDEKILEAPFGLINMGNTCYFNSVTQMFINLPPLQKLYFHPKFKYLINTKNKFGQKGKFIAKFLKLFNQNRVTLRSNLADFRNFVAKMNSQFDNDDQQDANEYLIFLLEAFHEEINLKSERKYIVNKDLTNMTEEEYSNIYWANALRRAASFINALFMFQLKSNLTCEKCHNEKITFETNYTMDLPISLGKMIQIEVILYRLPFCFKIYYEQISEKFKNFNEAHPNSSVCENLRQFAILEDVVDDKNLHRQLLMMSVPVQFKLDIERNKKLSELINTLRNISELQLEPSQKIANNDEENSTISRITINECTTFSISYAGENFLDPNTDIETYLGSSDTITFRIYELLNTNGINKIFEKNKEEKKENINENNNNNEMVPLNKQDNNITFELVSYQSHLQNKTSEEIIKSLIENNPKKISIISLDAQIALSKKEKKQDLFTNQDIYTEMIIPINHYHVGMAERYLFRKNTHIKINKFPRQYLIVNNSGRTLSGKDLYEYIFEINGMYLKVPNKNLDLFWWKNKDTVKKCYPFVLRIIHDDENFKSNNAANYNYVIYKLKCAKCAWFRFCPGCIVDPFDPNPIHFKPNQTIVVDWCLSTVKNEFLQPIFSLLYEINYEKIKQSLSEKFEFQEKSLKDCFSLFLEKEKLEDQLFCDKCRKHQFFTKNYEISKLPHILIISLKRFKYTSYSRHKLTNFIRYPINDLEVKDKKYDLFGVVNHYGAITHGHYTSIIRKDDKWFTLDDGSVYQVGENKVVHSNAYILFYISKENPEETNDYYRLLKSLIDNVILDEKNVVSVRKDQNFFKGEPVKTPYGCGYVLNDYLFNQKQKEKSLEDETNNGKHNAEPKNQIIEVKFDYGKGSINRKEIIKETTLNITNS